MKQRWFGITAWCVPAMVLLAACGGTEESSQDEQQGPRPVPTTCAAGEACGCDDGRDGTTTCDDGVASCECPECPELELPETTVADDCGGEPFGMWRLTKLELGVQPLELSVEGELVGTCDAVIAGLEEVPRMVLSLEDGGSAQYFAEAAPVKASWSESCVTSEFPEFSCGSSSWTNVSDCKLDCDICSCDTLSLAHNLDEEGVWQRTASTLTVAPWGVPVTFDYCIEDGELKLSADGAYLVFERAYTISDPTPCAERTAETCVVGGTCQLGQCVGDSDCAGAASEGECLTRQGCSWDAEVCQGSGTDYCGIEDFGVVPGCEFTDQEMICTGRPPECDTVYSDQCVKIDGCEVPEGGRCTGNELSCSAFDSCPVDHCTYDEEELSCSGKTSCGAFTSEEECQEANDAYPGTPCTWDLPYCEGTPTPCSEYSQETCLSQPACELKVP